MRPSTWRLCRPPCTQPDVVRTMRTWSHRTPTHTRRCRPFNDCQSDADGRDTPTSAAPFRFRPKSQAPRVGLSQSRFKKQATASPRAGCAPADDGAVRTDPNCALWNGPPPAGPHAPPLARSASSQPRESLSFRTPPSRLSLFLQRMMKGRERNRGASWHFSRCPQRRHRVAVPGRRWHGTSVCVEWASHPTPNALRPTPYTPPQATATAWRWAGMSWT